MVYSQHLPVFQAGAVLFSGSEDCCRTPKRTKGTFLAGRAASAGRLRLFESALEDEDDCASILQQIAACRGAINGLMGELMEGEVRDHVMSPKAKPGSDRARAAGSSLS